MPKTSENRKDWKFSRYSGVSFPFFVEGDVSAYTFAGIMQKGSTKQAFTISKSYNAGAGETDCVAYIISGTTEILETGDWNYQITWYSSANFKDTQFWGVINLTDEAFSV